MATIDSVRESIAGADSLVVLTGAGVSAESGVPTFRGTDGLWRKHNATELATPEAFEKDPLLVWEWYAWRRDLIRGVSPNPGHHAIVELEKRAKEFSLITQNVDGLHSMAGSINVVEMHGSIWKVRCTACGVESVDREVFGELPPRCACGGLLRPGVVWFGESLDADVIGKAFGAAKGASVMLVVGTSSVVQPAASLGAVARDAGAYVVEINIEETPMHGVADAHLTGRAGEVLPALL